MGRFARRHKNLGTVSIGASPTPKKIDENDPEIRGRRSEIEEDLKKKVEEYRKDNPEEPKTTSVQKEIERPLRTKHNIYSLDKEYVDMAKKYLGMADNSTPTIVDMAKGVIKLFEDNLRLYKQVSRFSSTMNGNNIASSIRHSWENSSEWN